ncbi:MAG TPA: NUDIX domain-containing protein [Chryseolinea sp.]
MKVIDKLAWIELKDKQILSTRSFGKDKYYIPGGKREAGESDVDALCREIREELSVQLDVATIDFVGVFEAQAHGQPEGTTVRMTCYRASYSGTLATAAEIEEMRWLRFGDKDKVAPVDILIFDFLKERDLMA